MKRKTALRFLPAVSLLIILAIVTSLVLTIPDQASGKTPIVPTPAKSADTDAVVVEKADYSFRVKELNRVLGIPKDDLAKLGHKEIKEKFKQNADKLGVRVYENIEKIDEKGAVVKKKSWWQETRSSKHRTSVWILKQRFSQLQLLSPTPHL
ncbi:MAG: hypothetical protein UU59_C0014G0018 [candidate division WWE3 bacterium GW2011_GWE1_41_27]|uniref:Uncharacterized protein n=1 Tax=candidate division WWE3 bacterium GW2011_GWE1_41_27 TaxID=1619131 RepID=A0A0G0Z2F9_UNCKA|nr:MAG: hypothetical protein UU59_C0014G0018 [candidate division WWE3 bacterium GW2011_GWE1_41_27]